MRLCPFRKKAQWRRRKGFHRARPEKRERRGEELEEKKKGHKDASNAFSSAKFDEHFGKLGRMGNSAAPTNEEEKRAKMGRNLSGEERKINAFGMICSSLAAWPVIEVWAEDNRKSEASSPLP